MTRSTEIVIAGAGPVGLALANFLGLYGRKVIVVEARDTIIDYPRAVGLDDESLRTIQGLGLSDAIMPFTIPHHVMRIVNGKGEVMVTNDPQAEPLGWPRKWGFNQPEVDKMMADALGRFPDVELCFSSKLAGIDDRGDKVIVTVEHGDGSTEEIEAQYLVGCEGGTSFTRKWMKTEFIGESPSTRWVVVDVRNDPLGVPNAILGADPARPYVSIGLPHAIRRWEFMLFDDEPSEKIEDDAFITELLKDHVPDSAQLDVIRRRVFTHHGRVAKTFRKGRVLIAGDAAHLMPVWLGQGWNSGMRDATNLAWKLATVVAGQASDALLDTYTAERREHAKAMVDLSMTFGRLIKPTDRRVAAARDLLSRTLNVSPQVKSYFADMKFKPVPRYESGVVVEPDTLTPGRNTLKRTSRFVTTRNAVDKRSPVGLQFIQPRVNTADAQGVRLDDALGPWWAVAAWGNDPARLFSEADRERMAAEGIKLVCFMSESQRPWAEQNFAGSGTLIVGDVDGSLKRWFDTRSTGVVFIRPDRFVAAIALAQLAPQALQAVFTAMSATPKEA